VIHEQESPTATGSLATVHRSIEEDVIGASWHGGGRKRYRVIASSLDASSSRLQLELMGQRVSRHRTGREKTFGHPGNNEIQIFTAETLQFGRRPGFCFLLLSLLLVVAACLAPSRCRAPPLTFCVLGSPWGSTCATGAFAGAGGRRL